MPYVRESAIVGGKEIIIETGKWAKEASGSVVIRCGDSMVLVTAAGSAQPCVTSTSCRFCLRVPGEVLFDRQDSW